MTGLASRFFASAIGYAILGMLLGLIMGMTQDHTQMPTHAHLLLVGWATFALFGLFYHAFPSTAATKLAQVHFWLAEASLIVLVIGLYLLFSGNPGADPIAAVASIGLLASMILFAAIAWPVLKSPR